MQVLGHAQMFVIVCVRTCLVGSAVAGSGKRGPLGGNLRRLFVQLLVPPAMYAF